MTDYFWNKTSGVRPFEPIPGLFADICESMGHHVYDDFYGVLECARCGHRDVPVKASWKSRLLRLPKKMRSS